MRVVGPTLESRLIPISPGDTFWGVRLHPAACRAVLGCTPATLRDRSVPCADVNSTLSHTLLRELNASASFETAIAAYSLCLRAANLDCYAVDNKVSAAARLIAGSGERKIQEIAVAVELSVRQLQRRFFRAVGLTPKQFARVRRIRATAVALVETQPTNWATLAAEVGFADQAHLAHEFAALTGRSPTSFERSVRKIEHGQLLK